MGLARKVADRVVFVDEGAIVENRLTNDFFNNPDSDRAKDFLSKILNH
jgi:glutamate/aspartate transport system ATP-binding protein